MVPSIQICGTFHRGDSVGGGGQFPAVFSLCLHKSVSGKQDYKRCKEALKTQPILLESAAHVHRCPETNGNMSCRMGRGVVGSHVWLTEHNQPKCDIITLSHVGLMISAQSQSWKSHIHLLPKLHKSSCFLIISEKLAALPKVHSG